MLWIRALVASVWRRLPADESNGALGQAVRHSRLFSSPRFAALLLCVLLFRPAEARADTALAEALFLEGRQALEEENYEAACPKFRESHRLDPAAGTVMNLATCLERLGKLASAWQSWQEGLQLLPAGDDRAPFATERVQELEKQLPYLTLRLAAGAPKNCSFFSNGVRLERAALDVALPVDPGEQVIVVKAPGRASRTFRIEMDLGDRRELKVAPGEPLPDPKAQEAASSRRTWAFIAGGVGLAGVGAGVATGLMLPSRRATVEDNCPDRLCNQAGLDAAAEGRALLLANTVGWIVGAAGLGAGTYLFLTSREPSPTPALGAGISADGATLSYSGRF